MLDIVLWGKGQSRRLQHRGVKLVQLRLLCWHYLVLDLYWKQFDTLFDRDRNLRPLSSGQIDAVSCHIRQLIVVIQIHLALMIQLHSIILRALSCSICSLYEHIGSSFVWFWVVALSRSHLHIDRTTVLQCVGLDSRWLLVVATYEDLTWVSHDALLSIEWTALSVNAACTVILCNAARRLKVGWSGACIGGGKLTLVRLF